MAEITDEELLAFREQAARVEQLASQIELLTSQAAEAETTRDALSGAQAEVRQATDAARAAIIAANPTIPADLITGDSITQINQSLAAAQAIAARLQEAAGKGPLGFATGGTQRQPVDTSALTPHQKIVWGLQNEKDQHLA